MVDRFDNEVNVQEGTFWKTFKESLPFFLNVLKVVLTHPNQIYEIWKMAQEAQKKEKLAGRKEKPKLSYEIPPYDPGMKHCTSNEKYLRPSRYIESDAPEIVAMANKLGAYQKPDREYAEACYKFVRRSITYSFATNFKGALETLHQGVAMCFDKSALFIALCRAGGIPARLRSTNTAFTEQIYEPFTTQIFPIMKDLYDSVGYFAQHMMAEALIDGEWLIGETSIDDDYQARLGLPLSRLGDDMSARWHWDVPGGVFVMEGFPSGLTSQMKFTDKLVKPITSLIQSIWTEAAKDGRKIIEEAGGEDAYDAKIRQTYKAKLPEVSKRLFKVLSEEMG